MPASSEDGGALLEELAKVLGLGGHCGSLAHCIMSRRCKHDPGPGDKSDRLRGMGEALIPRAREGCEPRGGGTGPRSRPHAIGVGMAREVAGVLVERQTPQ
jgi:hypothetical protein